MGQRDRFDVSASLDLTRAKPKHGVRETYRNSSSSTVDWVLSSQTMTLLGAKTGDVPPPTRKKRDVSR